MGANGACSLMGRYHALASRRMVVVGSGAVGLRTAALALEHGIDVRGVVEVGDRVCGDHEAAQSLARRGVPFYTSHTIRAAGGPIGEIDSVVLVRVDAESRPISGSEQEIACDTVCLALGLAPNVELLHLVGARLGFRSTLGGWVPDTDDWMRTSVSTVFAAGDCAGFHDGMIADPDVARRQGRLAAMAAAESLGAISQGEAERRRASSPPPKAPEREVHAYWQAWLRASIQTGGWDVNICQCEEVTRRELVEVRPPRYLKCDAPRMSARNLDTLQRDGPLNQDQIKRLTRAGMGPCQGRRCREQVALLMAQSAGTPVDGIPMPSFRPPLRPLPLNVLWPLDEPQAMRDDWVSWFGIPTQFSPHWAAGMAIAEPTAQTRLIQ
jgi:hypothetical protein